ncbi:MAG: N-acetylmuramoyl-L-alanine amidase [Candidatus Marinimicrobia bacterium]|jgi:N-acetylmuramoyl-L-alanine amidase|nr:N-acetylmuramoyl-L-alanine amidase [Candidatus Neomarinimicrobiota bacterium]MBT3838992.1 N-acetylmuramoyl-L-alanine amidase [Candidatus Neomarinimicrobiota bacterium]MBT3999333.1 N-acetylmuramoyl-L-alanine amidase [Candidatus Neomarinimicrobiota bacterium]MBT4282715.1 N-acetylmuramoyl-L-alanine amidase [Candidatus Neomarinimicrobiota bacterium]MBT4578279.1 N-acetylmuramoyl-L-alanine amidase [Candidatus Neomarinimicrobiota bacterium]
MLFTRIISFLFISSMLFGEIHVFNRSSGTESEIKTLLDSKKLYISAKDLSRSLSSRLYENAERKKLVLYIADRKVKISGNTSFIMIDDQPYQMSQITRIESNDLYVPAEAFFEILKSTVLPGINFDSKKEFLDIDVVRFNITGINIDVKSNGTIIRLTTRKPFSERNISSFINKHGWYYLTIAGAIVDTININNGITRGVIQRIESDQLGETAQVAFKLGAEVISHEWDQNIDPNEIVITLRTPLGKVAERLEDVKNRWRLDTIILDAGHGGKDPGSLGKYGTKEKDIVLDITKRVGRLLEKHTSIKVIYTRDEDVFVPLGNRTKMANDADGKVFVSIHANSNKNRKIQGFETFLHSIAKSDEAIEVASRENSVIQFEEKVSQYKDLSGEKKILATMTSSMFLKESEDLASIIQMELDKKLTTPNRGVKQAGFHVLYGASMPNVLVEVGFISNPEEEKKLKQANYRQMIAESVYAGINHFKYSREKLLAE